MTLVGHWPFNENSGDALDYSSYENHGTINGATQGASGILGETAYSFDGTDDYVNPGTLPSITNAATVSVWLKTNTISADQGVIWLRDNKSIRININFDGKGKANCWIYNGTSRSKVDISCSANEWINYTATWDGQTLKFYRDGVLEGTVQESTMDSGANSDLFGNSEPSDPRPFNGKMSNIRVYNRALSPHEVQYLYEVGQSGHYLSNTKTL